MLMMHLAPKPDMLAVELMHYETRRVPQVLARHLADRMGEPHARFNRSAHWYGEFEMVDVDEGHAELLPIAVAMFDDGTAEIQVKWSDRDQMNLALGMIAAEIVTVRATPTR